MADISINTNQRYLLNGVEFNAPIEWEEAVINADYKNQSVQPALQADSFTFTLEAREFILNWIKDGKIYEGLPLELTLFNQDQQTVKFTSLIDFTLGYRDLPEDGKIECTFISQDGLDNFFQLIGTTTYGYLENIGKIRNSDYIIVDYVVEKPFNFVEIIATTIVIYLMIKELQESIKRIAQDIAIIAGIAVSGATGTAGSIVYSVAAVILNLVYTTAIIIAIINLTTTLLEAFITIKRQHRVLNIRKALEVVCEHFGYGFETSVDIFSNVAYLPSNQELDQKNKFGFVKFPKGTQKGIPNAADIGYNCQEMFEIAKKLCDGKFAIIDKVVHLRPKDDPYWIKNSQLEITDEDYQIQQKTFNMDELEATKLLKFRTDINDEFTIDNYTGTSLEVRTDVISIGNQSNNTLKGFLEVDFGVALGNRKNELSPFEELLKTAAKIVDDVTGVLGGGTRFSAKIKDRVGILKQSTNNHSIPKLLYLVGNRMPTNHRTLFSAPTLYNNYYQDESFVSNNFRGQKAIYRDVTIPFGFERYNRLQKNSYFTFEGSEAKIINFEWTMGADTAKIDFEVREVFTQNLKETKIIQT